VLHFGLLALLPLFTPVRPRLPTLLAVLTFTWSATGWGAGVNCVDRMQISGSSAGELRARLRFGRLASLDSTACDNVTIHLKARSKGFLLSLNLQGEVVEREVQSLNDAATWTESWLEPIASETAPPAQSNSQVHAAEVSTLLKAASASANEAAPQISSLTVGAGPELSIGSNESAWLGPAMFGQYRMVSHFWLGLDLGYSWQLSDSWQRSLLRTAVLAGPAWDLNSRTALTAGIGIGIDSGRMRDLSNSSGRTMQSGGGFIELLARTTYEITPHWGISGALGGRWYAFTSSGKLVTTSSGDDSEESDHSAITASMPAEVPLLEFTTTLDVCYRFGGAP